MNQEAPSPTPAAPAPAPAMTREAAAARAAEIRTAADNPHHPLANESHPDHARVFEEYMSLHRVLAGEQEGQEVLVEVELPDGSRKIMAPEELGDPPLPEPPKGYVRDDAAFGRVRGFAKTLGVTTEGYELEQLYARYLTTPPPPTAQGTAVLDRAWGSEFADRAERAELFLEVLHMVDPVAHDRLLDVAEHPDVMLAIDRVAAKAFNPETMTDAFQELVLRAMALRQGDAP